MKKLMMLCAVAVAFVAHSENVQCDKANKECCDKQAKCEAAKKSETKKCEAKKRDAKKAKKIGKKVAVKIALEHAGVKREDTRDLSCELDREDGVLVYDIEFEAGNMEYDYEIDAMSGKVLKSWKERD
jgi:uncharacterized membrane protein YkoI